MRTDKNTNSSLLSVVHGTEARPLINRVAQCICILQVTRVRALVDSTAAPLGWGRPLQSPLTSNSSSSLPSPVSGSRTLFMLFVFLDVSLIIRVNHRRGLVVFAVLQCLGLALLAPTEGRAEAPRRVASSVLLTSGPYRFQALIDYVPQWGLPWPRRARHIYAHWIALSRTYTHAHT